MFDDKGFDSWADDYDREVGQTDKEDRYPFAGYQKILDGIIGIVQKKKAASILDVGFGTGTLAAKLYEQGFTIYGQDYSERMIELSKKKMPEAKLYKYDFSKGLAKPLYEQKYDFIISTYALHHLDIEGKIRLIREMMKLLKQEGKILIGDIAFETTEKMDQCKNMAGDEWDDEENYFVYEEFKKIFTSATFTPVSFCGAILSLKKE